MKLKPSQVKAHPSQNKVRVGLVKPAAANVMARAKRRGFGDMKRHALSISDMSMDVGDDIRKSRGFAPLEMQYKVLSWPEL